MKIAACLIVKNAGAMLERCLASIRPFVDEVCLYDTGSTDGTFKLVEKLSRATGLLVDPQSSRQVGEVVNGIDTFHRGEVPPADPARVPLAPILIQKGEWRDDFAWAREQSFAMVSDDVTFFLWLDDDDVVEGAQWLRQLAAMSPPGCDGFIFQYDYARDQHGNCVCVLWRERLIRRAAGYTWKGAVHEVLVPPDGQPARFATVPPQQIRYVHHRPPDRYPADRNLKILMAEAEACDQAAQLPPPRTLAYLGTEHMARGEWSKAAAYLDRYLQHPEATWGDERAQVYHKLATCFRALGNPAASVESEMRALRERHDWGETYVGLSQGYAALGNWAAAEHWAGEALKWGMPHSPLILNPLEFTFLPLVTIADACAALGKWPEAREAIQKAQQVCPNEYATARAAEIDRLASERQIVDAILLQREVLVRHDENLKALHLLESVPYIVAEHPELVKARADQRENCKHALKPDEYARWYMDEPKESTVDDEYVPEIGDFIPRAKRLLEGLREQEQELGRKPELLDLGSNDMWIAAYLWKQGRYVADGVELNRQSVEKGERRRKRFKFPGRLIQGDLHDAAKLTGQRYDAVSLFEVLEHVPDPARTLDVCEKLLRPGGRVYISTPNGAYERGQLNGWARVERKGHLRAIPIHDMIETVLHRGRLEYGELQHDERVSFVSYTPRRRKGKIVFYTGAGWEPWSPQSILEGGLGGSETALAKLSWHLAERGYEVKVYSGAEPCVFGQVLFRPNGAWDPTEECDLLVVSRLPHVFDNRLGARATALWCHDHSYPGAMTEARAQNMTHVVCLSDWEKARYTRLYPYLDGKIVVCRNGITYTDATGEDQYPDGDRPFTERAPRVVYSSSADRGLDVMLELWPRIREQVPEAELHVFYGWNVFDQVARANPGLADYKRLVFHLVAQAGGEDGGVFMRGRVGQAELAREMQQARVWGYPTAFLETSCIGAMEARAAGLGIVTSNLGALTETVGTHGVRLPWGADEDEPINRSEGYQASFVNQVALLLTDGAHWTGWHQRARQGADTNDWARRISLWEALVPARQKATRRKRERVAA